MKCYSFTDSVVTESLFQQHCIIYLFIYLHSWLPSTMVGSSVRNKGMRIDLSCRGGNIIRTELVFWTRCFHVTCTLNMNFSIIILHYDFFFLFREAKVYGLLLEMGWYFRYLNQQNLAYIFIQQVYSSLIIPSV